MPRCPDCGKNVGTFPSGKLRPHAVPIGKRKGDGYERCEPPVAA